MKKFAATVLAALGMLAVPAIASAETAYTNASVNLRTGPDADYPRIVTLRAGQRVEIYGCINDWSWCDVETGRERGWISSAYLDYDYRGRRVGVSRYGAEIGLPILSFILGTYWDDHYRGKSWYSQRSHWENRTPAHAGRVQQQKNPPQQQQSPQPNRAQQQGKQQNKQQNKPGDPKDKRDDQPPR
ncbi:MAG: SH3 domain-containing protein [Pseudoxanthomonas sp.]